MPHQILRRKEVAGDSHTLRKCLGALDLTLLGVGAIIGTGIFVLTGVAAATTSGPGVVLSFVVAGTACAFAALAYAELAASVGGSGSAYGYAYAAFGELVAWIIGWDLVLEYGVAMAAVANGWAGYLDNALDAIGLPLPDMLTRGPFAVDAAGTAVPGLVNLPAAAIVLLLTGLLCLGARESARLNFAMVFVKLAAIAVFLVVATSHIDAANWSPFAPFGWFSHDASGRPVGILAGASVVFFAYVGFDAVSTAVEEAHQPKRDVPIGILGSLAFCTLIYVIVSGVLTGIVPYSDLNVSSPVAHALAQIGIDWASALVATGVIAGLTTVMLVLFYGLTRILYAMARDGLVPPFFARVHERTRTPVHGTVCCGVAMALMAGLIPLGTLAELVNIGTLAAFILVCAGVAVLRRTRPDMPRPFLIPGGLTVPLMGLLSCAALICFLPHATHLRFVLWLLLGLVVYWLYGYRHSKLREA